MSFMPLSSGGPSCCCRDPAEQLRLDHISPFLSANLPIFLLVIIALIEDDSHRRLLLSQVKEDGDTTARITAA